MKEKHRVLTARLNLVRVLKRHSSDPLAYKLLLEVYEPSEKDKERFVAFSCEKDGYLSYARRPEHRYSVKSRVRIKVGRYLRQFYAGDIISDEDIGRLSCILGFAEKCGVEPRIVEGHAITEIYRQEFGHSSCMTGDDCDKVELYAINPDKIQMALIDDTFKARALIWTMDDGTRYLDRQYGNAEAAGHLVKWAEEQGWNHYDKRRETKMICTLQRPDLFPYLDTMRYARVRGDEIVLCNMSSFDYNYCLDRTDGNLEDVLCCSSCGEDCSEEDATQEECGTYCSDCWSERFRLCERCGETCRSDDTYTVNVDGDTEEWCEGCRNARAFYCERSEEYYSERNYSGVLVDGETWEEGQAERHAFEWRDGSWHRDEEEIEETEIVEEVEVEAT